MAEDSLTAIQIERQEGKRYEKGDVSSYWPCTPENVKEMKRLVGDMSYAMVRLHQLLGANGAFPCFSDTNSPDPWFSEEELAHLRGILEKGIKDDWQLYPIKYALDGILLRLEGKRDTRRDWFRKDINGKIYHKNIYTHIDHWGWKNEKVRPTGQLWKDIEGNQYERWSDDSLSNNFFSENQSKRIQLVEDEVTKEEAIAAFSEGVAKRW